MNTRWPPAREWRLHPRAASGLGSRSSLLTFVVRYAGRSRGARNRRTAPNTRHPENGFDDCPLLRCRDLQLSGALAVVALSDRVSSPRGSDRLRLHTYVAYACCNVKCRPGLDDVGYAAYDCADTRSSCALARAGRRRQDPVIAAVSSRGWRGPGAGAT